MWQRTPPHPKPRNHFELSPASDDPSDTRPGQIYLRTLKQLSHEKQEFIQSIQDLKDRNDQITHKLQQKRRLPLTHLHESTHLPSNTRHSDSLVYGGHYEITNLPYSGEQRPSEADSRSLRQKSQERSNSIYRIIKQTHLQNLQEMENFCSQSSPQRTAKKMPKFEQNDPNPSTSKLVSKYFANAERLASTPGLMKQRNAVYLPVPQECKQKLIQQHYKQHAPKAEYKSNKANDNTPYRSELQHSQKYRSVYYTKQRGEEELQREDRYSRIVRLSTLH